MARNLKTGWVCLATSGSVVHGETDGRFMKKEWLQDMAETFNTKLFTPKIWPEHRRYYSAGTVLAVKLEPATDPELKGEIQLFGILAPTDWLIHANREGDFTFPSIEVGENFRGTGKFFLAGLGVTDQPASVGVNELKFSTKDGDQKANVVAGHQFNLAEELQGEEKTQTLIQRIFCKASDFPRSTPEPEEDTMTEAQFNQLETKLKEHIDAQFSAMKKDLTPAAGEGQSAGTTSSADGGQGTEAGEGGDTSTQFATLQEEHTTLKDQFAELEKQFKALQNTPSGTGTNPGENDGDGETRRVL